MGGTVGVFFAALISLFAYFYAKASSKDLTDTLGVKFGCIFFTVGLLAAFPVLAGWGACSYDMSRNVYFMISYWVLVLSKILQNMGIAIKVKEKRIDLEKIIPHIIEPGLDIILLCLVDHAFHVIPDLSTVLRFSPRLAPTIIRHGYDECSENNAKRLSNSLKKAGIYMSLHYPVWMKPSVESSMKLVYS